MLRWEDVDATSMEVTSQHVPCTVVQFVSDYNLFLCSINFGRICFPLGLYEASI